MRESEEGLPLNHNQKIKQTQKKREINNDAIVLLLMMYSGKKCNDDKSICFYLHQIVSVVCVKQYNGQNRMQYKIGHHNHINI